MLALILTIWLSLPTLFEPSYHGRSIRYWVNRLGEFDGLQYHAETQEALRSIGADAVPWLMKELEVRNAANRDATILWLRDKFHLPERFHAASERRALAAIGLYVLGATGSNSIPALIRQLGDPEIYPRVYAAAALGEIRTNARDTIPALITALNDKVDVVVVNAATALTQYGLNAKQAVPALTNLVTNTNQSIQKAASRALKKIDAEAAVKAGLK